MAEPPLDPERGADEDPPHWDAVVNLYLDHKTAARRAAGWILGSPLDPEIQDVIQDAIVKAARTFYTLREPEHARGWFLTIVSRQARDRRRARLRRGRKESPVGSAGDLEKVCGSAQGMSPEVFPLLRASLEFVNTLPEKQRVAYLLKHFFGLDHKDIALVLECSPRTVSTHLRRAQAKVDKKFPPAADLAKEAQHAQLRRSTA